MRLFFIWRNKIRKLRERVEVLTPYQKCKLVYSCVDTIFRWIGMNVTNDCTRNWRTLLPGIAVMLVPIIQINSLWFYWDKNKITAVGPLAILAMITQVNIFENIYSSPKVL